MDKKQAMNSIRGESDRLRGLLKRIEKLEHQKDPVPPYLYQWVIDCSKQLKSLGQLLSAVNSGDSMTNKEYDLSSDAMEYLTALYSFIENLLNDVQNIYDAAGLVESNELENLDKNVELLIHTWIAFRQSPKYEIEEETD